MHICLDMIAELLALPQLEQPRAPALYASSSSISGYSAGRFDRRFLSRSDSVSSLSNANEMDWEPATKASSAWSPAQTRRRLDSDASECSLLSTGTEDGDRPETGLELDGGLPSPQVLAVHLAAHLSTQYAVPKAQSVAHFCFDAIDTFLTCTLIQYCTFIFPVFLLFYSYICT